MTSKDGTAEIFDMEDARARRCASQLPGADYSDAGAHLAAVREASGLTIAEAAAKTHIQEHHLVAIETLDAAAMPARPYAIGFVKVYAMSLDLDAPRIVDRFKVNMGFSAPPEVDAEKFAAHNAAGARAGELSLLAVAAIIAFFIWCAWQIALIDGHKHTGAKPDQAVQAPAALSDLALTEVVEAHIIERIEPVFPRGCLNDAAPVETVMVAFNITAAGRIAGERIAATSNACFNASALNAVRRWRFEPRTVDGAPRALHDQKARFSFDRPQ